MKSSAGEDGVVERLYAEEREAKAGEDAAEEELDVTNA